MLSNQVDSGSIWSLFDFIEQFSTVSQLTVERIPLDEARKHEQSQFRQAILEAITKIMKKVVDKLNTIT